MKTRYNQIDMEIAEKVLGWKKGTLYGNGNGEWLDEKGVCFSTWNQTPRFFTDIAAAWQVVECLQPDWLIDVDWEPKPKVWTCRLVHNKEDKHHAVQAETAPLAICRAALKALGGE